MMAYHWHAFDRDVLQDNRASNRPPLHVSSRLVRKYRMTNGIKDLPRSGRPTVTTQREGRALVRLVLQQPFATSTRLMPLWLPHRRLSLKTLRNLLRAAGLASRRIIMRPLLPAQHQRTRLQWCLARRGWNLRSWRRIHWSDKSRFCFMLRMAE